MFNHHFASKNQQFSWLNHVKPILSGASPAVQVLVPRMMRTATAPLGARRPTQHRASGGSECPKRCRQRGLDPGAVRRALVLVAFPSRKRGREEEILSECRPVGDEIS